MAHFAKVVNGIVTEIIVAEPDFFDTFTDSSPGQWIQTSYNTRGGKHYDPATGLEDDVTPLRKNYAGVGCVYDSENDAFHAPKPYDSWTLNSTTYLWEAPVARPDDDNDYMWNETDGVWEQMTEDDE